VTITEHTSDEDDLRPDMFNFGLHKASLLWFHVAIPVLPTAINHSTVDTFQYIPATPTQHHNCTGINMPQTRERV